MKIYIFSFLLLISASAKADLFGGDLPLLAEIVANDLPPSTRGFFNSVLLLTC